MTVSCGLSQWEESAKNFFIFHKNSQVIFRHKLARQVVSAGRSEVLLAMGVHVHVHVSVFMSYNQTDEASDKQNPDTDAVLCNVSFKD